MPILIQNNISLRYGLYYVYVLAPIWLILYAIINCGVDTPGKITILGATISLIGAIICSTGESDGSKHENESLGAMIATFGAVGGAAYMTACRELMPVGINPIILSLTINVGMATTTFILSMLTLPNGISFFSTNIHNGFFGFLNPEANPAALFHSVFPDLGGNFGIMIALSYFEPLIVSMVMLTEVSRHENCASLSQLPSFYPHESHVFLFVSATQCKHHCNERGGGSSAKQTYHCWSCNSFDRVLNRATQSGTNLQRTTTRTRRTNRGIRAS